MSNCVTGKDCRYVSCPDVLPVRAAATLHVHLCNEQKLQVSFMSGCATGEDYSYVACLPVSPVRITDTSHLHLRH